MKRVKISSGGQISVPAAIRHRWGTSTVVIDDRGDHAILRPAPDDAVASASGALREEFGRLGLSTEELRAELRAEEHRAERRKLDGRTG